MPPSTSVADAPSDLDIPRQIVPVVSRSDRTFQLLAAAAAVTALLIVSATAFFLVWRSVDAFQSAGVVDFFTTSVWNPSEGKFGVKGLLIGTVLIAGVALIVAVPLGIGLALFVNEYAPARIRACPGLGRRPAGRAAEPDLRHLGPLRPPGPAHGRRAVVRRPPQRHPVLPDRRAASELSRSGFVGGVVVGLMILPIITSVSREVMAQCPRDQCEAALGARRLALGDDHVGHPAVLAFGHGRRHAPRLRPGPRRDDRRRDPRLARSRGRTRRC